MTLYAQWAAGTGTAYKVEHWQQNIADDGYTLAKTEPMTGTTGEKTAAKAEETAGFTAKEFAQAKIAADGSTVVKIHYDRKIITLTFDADNGEDKTTLSGKFGAEIASPSPEKTDFIFTGWSTDKIPTESSKSYKDKEKITLTENLTLYAQWKEIAKVFYTVKFDANGGTGEMNEITAESRIEIAITENSFTKVGWTFSGWNTKTDGTGESYNDKTKITLFADVTLYAQWAAGTGTAYKVEHWQQNIADDDYTRAKTEPMTGTTGEETAAKAEETAGFTAKEFAQAKIAADGSTVVKIHYDRKIITLTFDADNGGNKTTLSGKFGAEIVSPSPEKTDFIFTGWSTDKIPTESSKLYKEKITLTEDLTLYAQWKEDVVNIIKNLTAGTHTVCVTGEIDEDTVKSIGKALHSNKHAKVNLDLSGTTGLKNIPFQAFCDCANLINIEIPESVTSIGNYAFEKCTSLTTIKIPESVTSIGNSAFKNCTNLTTMEIPESITSIGGTAFEKCTSLTTIEIPESVTSIGYYTFYGCTNLTNIEIPKSVTSIEVYAFDYCPNLTTVNYMGTIEQWNSISVNSGNQNLASAKIICTDGIINGD